METPIRNRTTLDASLYPDIRVETEHVFRRMRREGYVRKSDTSYDTDTWKGIVSELKTIPGVYADRPYWRINQPTFHGDRNARITKLLAKRERDAERAEKKTRTEVYNEAVRLHYRAYYLMVELARDVYPGTRGWLEALIWTRALQDVMRTAHNTAAGYTSLPSRYYWDATTESESEAAQKTVDMWCDAFGSTEEEPTMKEAIERFK